MSRIMYDVDIRNKTLKKLDKKHIENKEYDSGKSIVDLLLSFNNPNMRIEEIHK